MNLKLLSSLFLSLFLLVGCSQSGEQNGSDQNETTEENTQPPASGSQGMAGDTEVSDEELEQFVALSQELQVMTQEVQQEMITAVENGGFDLQRFSEMDKADRNPKTELEGTPKELESYREVSEKLNTMQDEAREEMQSKMKERGFTEQRLQEINIALQKDTTLQKRYMSMQQPAMQPPVQ